MPHIDTISREAYIFDQMGKFHADNRSKITALITGGTRGIGLAIAKQIAPHAKQLLITAKTAKHFPQARRALTAMHSPDIFTFAANHANPTAAADRIGRWARSHVGSLDLLVLNAGYYVEGSLATIAKTDFETNLHVNFTVNHYLVQQLLPLVRKSALRRIVFIGSTAAYEAYPAVPTYGVAKWALRGYAINLRKELMKEKIGVVFLAPGGTLTGMWDGESIPAGRLLDPQDIARLVETQIVLSPQADIEELICRPMLGDLHD